MARVLVIADCHAPAMRRGYIEFLKRIADDHGINRVVHIGDLADWSSISFHEKSPSLSNATTEFTVRKASISYGVGVRCTLVYE